MGHHLGLSEFYYILIFANRQCELTKSAADVSVDGTAMT